MGAVYQNTGVQLDEVNGTLKAAVHKSCFLRFPAKYKQQCNDILQKLALYWMDRYNACKTPSICRQHQWTGMGADLIRYPYSYRIFVDDRSHE